MDAAASWLAGIGRAPFRGPAAWAALRRRLLEPLSLADLDRIDRLIAGAAKRWRTSAPRGALRLAILGGYTTRPVRLAAQAQLLGEGYFPEIYEAEYNTFRMEALDAKSRLYAFKPSHVLFATGAVNLEVFPAPAAAARAVEALAARQVEDLAALWSAVRSRTAAVIFQNNFEPAEEQPLGGLESKWPWSPAGFVQRLNQRLWEKAPPGVHIVDVAGLAGRVGLRRWRDPRWFFHGKHGFDPALAHEYGRLFGGVFRAAQGLSKKCLVLDLDNLLWGGAVGDDGVAGIALGSGSAEGEAYAAFCRYLKRLKQRGVFLAVNSKNDPAAAREVFAKHPEMPLALEDFSAFVCNWRSKSSNLAAIARGLNIGADAVVFIDDSPVECAEVRKALPEVAVVEMEGDPAGFVRRLDGLHLFDALALTREDLGRAATLEAGREIEKRRGDARGLDDFLRSLRMTGRVAPAAPGDAARLEQLFLKTNQFNLTARRYGSAEVMAIGKTKGKVCLACRFSDRFAEYGLVSALVGGARGKEFWIDNWVMSCRVFSRTLEEFMMQAVKSTAKAMGCAVVRGGVVATKKNAYVRDLFPKLGFRRAGAGWTLDLRTAPALKTFVKEKS